jgi:hypothetical protein
LNDDKAESLVDAVSCLLKVHRYVSEDATKVVNVLERIATALEKLASATYTNKQTGQTFVKINGEVSTYES